MKSILNQKSKVVILILLCILILSAGSVELVFATAGGVSPVGGGSVGGVSPVSNCPSGQLCNPLQVNSIGDAINKGVEIFSYIAILVAVIMIIYVGLKFIMAQGKPDKLKEAGKWLGAIVIGVAIILGARLMISIVINTLEATKVVSPTVIQSARSVI